MRDFDGEFWAWVVEFTDHLIDSGECVEAFSSEQSDALELNPPAAHGA